MKIRGISYLIDEVPATQLRRDLAAIREQLHCTAVMIIGSDREQLATAADQAVEAGLEVWIRPQLRDRPWPELLAHLRHVAESAEELRRRHPDRVTLLVGSEFSHTAPGMVPGGFSYARLMVIIRAGWLFRRRITRRLDELLKRAVGVARERFAGPVGYAAAGWERVDWTRFDVVGVSLYRSGTDHQAYADRVAVLAGDRDRPVIITEFGCGSFVGADRRGAGSFRIVNWFTARPQVRDGHPRNESVQADYLSELIDLYASSGVDGCFVFTFAMADFPRHDDPRRDLDRAGFGVVAVRADEPDTWTPKQSFHAVARRYATLARHSASPDRKP